MYTYDECYKISTEIIKLYETLTRLAYSPKYDNESYKNIIKTIKRLLIDEYNLINQLTKKETLECIDKINENPNQINDKANSRLRRRFATHNEILKNQMIKGRELNINSIPSNMKFGIYDALESMIKIETLKKIKGKIDALSPQCKQDRHFVTLLNMELNASKISLLSEFNTAELIGISSNMDLNIIPQISIEVISNKFKQEFNKQSTVEGMDVFNHILSYIAEKNITYLSEIIAVKNNPQDIYQYLYRITELEVLISYMSKTALNRFSKYCNSVIFSNPASIENTKKLIREKLKEKNK